MWGNPMGEIMYESLRYFAGETGGAADLLYGTVNDSKNTLSLPKPSWGVVKGGTTYRPYTMFPPCTKASMIVISDVNK